VPTNTVQIEKRMRKTHAFPIASQMFEEVEGDRGGGGNSLVLCWRDD
jgi:hypothetical protein